VAELKKEESNARPTSGRAFLSRMAEIELPGFKAHILFWSITVFGIALDLWSKSAIFSWLQRRPTSSFSIVDGFLHLVMFLNEGAAFGIASGQRQLLVAVSVIALIVIFAVFLFSGAHQKLMHIALGLFAAGVCGNLYDRIFNNGLVRDFIDIVYWRGRHWPAFNIADSMLCIAVGLLVVSSLFTGKSSRKRARQHK
jgi:signal peptidase II